MSYDWTECTYPLPEGCHPERPWWRQTQGSQRRRMDNREWVRVDGTTHVVPCDFVRSIVEMLGDYDREHPLPPPPPMCGQVWLWSGYEATIGSLTRNRPGPGLVELEWGTQLASTWYLEGENREFPAWPPTNAVLVAGPGAPWEDTSVKP